MDPLVTTSVTIKSGGASHSPQGQQNLLFQMNNYVDRAENHNEVSVLERPFPKSARLLRKGNYFMFHPREHLTITTMTPLIEITRYLFH